MRELLIVIMFFCYLHKSNGTNPGYLGIMIRDYTNQQIKGVQVVNVFDESAAKQYGLKENDIITAVNNISTFHKDKLISIIEQYSWGDLVVVDYIRKGLKKTTEIYLGYKGSIRTYNVSKKIKQDGEHWMFADDNTEVLLKYDNTPVSITKIDENGVIDTWFIGSDYKTEEVPQYFLDISDKLGAIIRIKEDQEKRNCTINDITYIKEIKDIKPVDNITTTKEIIPGLFSIFPNPTKGEFTLNFSSNDEGSINLIIFDITGRIVQFDLIQNYKGSFSKNYDLQNEPKGAYLIQIKIGDKLTTKKILLQ